MSDANPRDEATVASDSDRRFAPIPSATSPRYHPDQLHARGGLGEVWLAHDQELHREVALKRIQARHANDLESRRRFLLEAEITGRLEHPGVVPVYGAQQGEDGQPCYAMRFIRGETLQEAIQHFHDADKPGRDPGERSVAFRQLLGRFVAVCNTVAYAHSRGILHRDLKPSNVMLGKYGETLVVDWGLAKPFARGEEAQVSGEDTLAPSGTSGDGGTLAGQLVGTPAYASPEQAAGRLEALGPASDVYSLGATLYALLTGRAPFQGRTDEILARVQAGRFTPPDQVTRGVPLALAAVCRKSMALQPCDRYVTAQELAAEVERFLADEPVQARRETVFEKVERGCRRRPMLAALLVLFVVADVSLLTSLLSSIVLSGDVTPSWASLRTLWAFAVVTASLMQAAAVVGGLSGGAIALGVRLFRGAKAARVGSWAISGARGSLMGGFVAAVLALLGFVVEEMLTGPLSPGPGVSWVWSAVAVAAAGPVLGVMVGGWLALRQGRWLGRLASGAFVGSLISVCGAAPLFSIALEILQRDTDEEHLSRPVFLSHSADGTRIVGGWRDGRVVVYDAATGQAAWEAEGERGLPWRGVVLYRCAFSADGRRLARSGWDGRVSVWDARDGRPLLTLDDQGASQELAFSPDGRRLAVANRDGSLRVWDVETGREVRSRAIQRGPLPPGAFSPDGRRLATYGPDGMKVVSDFWD